MDDRATVDDLQACYRLLLGRKPDPDGFGVHQASLPDVTVAELVETFMSSKEFRLQPAYTTIVNQSEVAELVRLEVDGRVMYVHPDDPMSWPMLSGDGWEPDVTPVFARVLRRGMTVLDIGANMGHFALLAAQAVGADGTVHAFEPGADAASILQLSAMANGFGHLVVHNVALADRTGALIHELLTGSNARVISVDLSKPIRLGGRRSLVRTIRLDDAGLDRVDVLKIDVEGAEGLVMAGGAATVRRYRPVIISEFMPTELERTSGIGATDYLELVIGLGYGDVAVIRPDGWTESFGQNVSAVVDAWRATGREHVDLVFTPE
jgi:FkbM family methyltransferase